MSVGQDGRMAVLVVSCVFAVQDKARSYLHRVPELAPIPGPPPLLIGPRVLDVLSFDEILNAAFEHLHLAASGERVVFLLGP